MRKALMIFLMWGCLLGLFGCSSADTALETSSVSNAPVQSTEVSGTDERGANEKVSWSEEDIKSMFFQAKGENWEYADCVLIPDQASERIGAVLFWDNEKGTSNVAFFDAAGDCLWCGTYAKLSAEPDFTYVGDGTVTFKLETEDGVNYTYKVTILVDGDNVNFRTEDDLSAMKK